MAKLNSLQDIYSYLKIVGIPNSIPVPVSYGNQGKH